MYILTTAVIQAIEEHYFVEEFCDAAPRLFASARAAKVAVTRSIAAERRRFGKNARARGKESVTQWKLSKSKAGGEFCDHSWGDPKDNGFGTRHRLFKVPR